MNTDFCRGISNVKYKRFIVVSIMLVMPIYQFFAAMWDAMSHVFCIGVLTL